MPKIKPHKKKSFISEALSKRILTANIPKNNFVISFSHLDPQQGDTFKKWEEKNVLSNAMETLKGYCDKPIAQQMNDSKFTHYKGFPPSDKTSFSFPKHIPEDACWARIHVDGLTCIIGHVVKNTFYVVFLDGDHSFWKSEKK